LEKPTPPAQYVTEEYAYKVFISGKSGVGKTSTVAKLTGNEIPALHSETPGMNSA
jgi:GTP-binding protein EngB required for normal cell division